ncbi:DUF2537 domain-containing protein [Amycolatopsis sp.]|uniref:DUF2537 domain-containing protein n=1 Tax=Amycolatopsis sp. TaxID=37632 RepID=UPI002DFC826D|nr:DUF2537 domain-containing protein [Amycolatopsis sp.]
MELRIRGERAVLAGPGGPGAREVDPHDLAIGAELADALHEWARVASAVRRAGDDEASGEQEATAVVSQRGRQLAARVAAVMGTTVHYLDPVTQAEVLITPPNQPTPEAEPAAPSLLERLFGVPDPEGEPTPWLTGLTVAGFAAAVVVIAMLALAGTLARETSGWLALLASVVVTGGLAPSLWLARKMPILRWAALGAAAGVLVSWVGVLVESL